MQSAKVCVVGDFAVGKTSTVERFVSNTFSAKYLTTLGVKVDTYVVDDGERPPLKLVLWDVAGTERFSQREFAYLRGAAAYLLVADGTRKPTLGSALSLSEDITAAFGERPRLLLLNKSDLASSWELDDADTAMMQQAGLPFMASSAKTGVGVTEAFTQLADMIINT